MQHPHTRQPITYVATHFPAVSHTFIADEIDALEREGADVRVISINTVSDADRQADTKGRHERTIYLKDIARWRALLAVAATVLRHPSVLTVPLRSGPPGLRPRLWRCFHLAEGILVFRAMRRSGSTHVHAHFGQTPASIAWYAVEVARRHRGGAQYRWSTTIHGWHEFVDEHAAQLRQKVGSATFVACISDFTRSQLMRISDPSDWPKLHVVRCGIDLSRFTLRTHEPANTPPRIALVARVSAEKGHAVLIDAIALLRERGITVAVDAIGPEPDGHGAVLRRRADAAGVAEAITWHGPQPPTRVAELLAAADVFCLPTFAEGLPVVIMEAMARGVPVVTTYISGIPELAIDGETALVMPAARPDLLADALERLLADDALRAQLVAGAAAAVAARHDIRSNAPTLLALFDDAAKAAPR